MSRLDSVQLDKDFTGSIRERFGWLLDLTRKLEVGCTGFRGEAHDLIFNSIGPLCNVGRTPQGPRYIVLSALRDGLRFN